VITLAFTSAAIEPRSYNIDLVPTVDSVMPVVPARIQPSGKAITVSVNDHLVDEVVIQANPYTLDIELNPYTLAITASPYALRIRAR
jgi:hypothetical protein